MQEEQEKSNDYVAVKWAVGIGISVFTLIALAVIVFLSWSKCSGKTTFENPIIENPIIKKHIIKNPIIKKHIKKEIKIKENLKSLITQIKPIYLKVKESKHSIEKLADDYVEFTTNSQQIAEEITEDYKNLNIEIKPGSIVFRLLQSQVQYSELITDQNSKKINNSENVNLEKIEKNFRLMLKRFEVILKFQNKIEILSEMGLASENTDYMY